LNTIELSSKLKAKAHVRGNGLPSGSVVPPKKGKGGAIKIAYEYAQFYGAGVSGIANNDAEVMMTYGHELAVLLDMRKNPKGKNGKAAGFVYGRPGVDPDTGQAMEDCMKFRLPK
jgi:hypothetical protein